VRVAEARAANQERVDDHDYDEAVTRELFIDLLLKEAGWPLDQERDREFPVTGMPTQSGTGAMMNFIDEMTEDGRRLFGPGTAGSTCVISTGRRSPIGGSWTTSSPPRRSRSWTRRSGRFARGRSRLWPEGRIRGGRGAGRPGEVVLEH
jgi:hypothetical protein